MNPRSGSSASLLGSIDHVVTLMLENRSFDHMLGFLYTDRGNVSPAGDPFAGPYRSRNLSGQFAQLGQCVQD
jgi:phospholipase C